MKTWSCVMGFQRVLIFLVIHVRRPKSAKDCSSLILLSFFIVNAGLLFYTPMSYLSLKSSALPFLSKAFVERKRWPRETCCSFFDKAR